MPEQKKLKWREDAKKGGKNRYGGDQQKGKKHTEKGDRLWIVEENPISKNML